MSNTSLFLFGAFSHCNSHIKRVSVLLLLIIKYKRQLSSSEGRFLSAIFFGATNITLKETQMVLLLKVKVV
jgi:hypothetical protein